jgi:hypothetical protein
VDELWTIELIFPLFCTGWGWRDIGGRCGSIANGGVDGSTGKGGLSLKSDMVNSGEGDQRRVHGV